MKCRLLIIAKIEDMKGLMITHGLGRKTACWPRVNESPPRYMSSASNAVLSHQCCRFQVLMIETRDFVCFFTPCYFYDYDIDGQTSQKPIMLCRCVYDASRVA